MLTTCNHCQTTFHVTAAQLELRSGKVRCGECGEIFSALASLQSDPANLQTPPANISPAPETATPAPPPADAFTRWEPPLRTNRFRQNPDRNPHHGLTRYPMKPRTATPPSALPPAHEPDSRLDAPHPRPEPEYLPDDSADEVAPPVSRIGRFLRAVLTLLLLCGLLAQGAYFYRTELALWLPESRPALERLCHEMGCRVELPRSAEWLDIAHSDLRFDPAKPNRITLEMTLRNRAPYPQGFPLIDLALKSNQDKILARRILTPEEYAQGRSLPAGIPARGEIVAALQLDLVDLPATGYELALFYPRHE